MPQFGWVSISSRFFVLEISCSCSESYSFRAQFDLSSPAPGAAQFGLQRRAPGNTFFHLLWPECAFSRKFVHSVGPKRVYIILYDFREYVFSNLYPNFSRSPLFYPNPHWVSAFLLKTCSRRAWDAPCDSCRRLSTHTKDAMGHAFSTLDLQT